MSLQDEKNKSQKRFQILVGPLIAYGVVGSYYFAMKHGTFTWFSWHPVMMFISFITLALNAALIKKIGGYDNTKMHGYLMAGATVCGLFGWYVIHTNKDMYNKPHLVSYHGQLGVLVLIAYTSIALFGVVALHPDWGVMKTDKTLRAVHKYAGRAMTVLSWVVIMLGVIKMETSPVIRLCFALPLIPFGLWCLL